MSERRLFGCSRPVPEPGKCYRNGAGQVRRLLTVVDGVATFRVVKNGAGNNRKKRIASHPPGFLGTMTFGSFRSWAVAECNDKAEIIPTPGLRAPIPDTRSVRRRLAEALKAAV